jgi:pimeloyl-ACP methyl ester carboxylesterase
MVFLHGFPEACLHLGRAARTLRQTRPTAATAAWRPTCAASNAPARLTDVSRLPGQAPAGPGHRRSWSPPKAPTAPWPAWWRTTGAAPSAGAIANAFAAAARHRLVIINSPHPGTFTRELRNNPAQQQASAYMNFLARPDAEALLAADDFKRMWPFFLLMKAGPDGHGWLTEEVKQKYREVWGAGLTGACNLYRVTPMKPPLPGQTIDGIPVLPRERLVVEVPTFVFWALDDAALLPGLLEGLDEYVPKLEVKKVPNATHWIVHEQPQLVAREIEAFLRRAQ